MTVINPLIMPFNDFKLQEVIDPDQFDTNNLTVSDKINETILLVNEHETVKATIAYVNEVAANLSQGILAPGTITDTMLTDVVGNIKERFSTHLTDYMSRFGNGTPNLPPNNDLNNITESGIYTTTGVTLNIAPTGSSGSGVLAMVYSSDTQEQLWIGRILNVIYVRRKATGVWQPWVEVLNASSKGVANGIATLGTDARLPGIQLPITTKGSSTQTKSFPVVTGVNPNSVFTIISVLLPIASTAEEVDIIIKANTVLKLIRGFNYAISHLAIFPTNLSTWSGATYTGDTSTVGSMTIISSGLFGAQVGYLYLVDAYISGSNVVLKFINPTTNTLQDNKTQVFDYVTRG